MLIAIQISPDERALGLLVHYRVEGVPEPPPAPRCSRCKCLLDPRVVKRHGRPATTCTFCGRISEGIRHSKGLVTRGDGGWLGLLAILLCVMITLGLPSDLHGQGNLGSNSSPVVNRQGIPLGGASIAVCQPVATTSASVSNGLATLVMSSNPITAGYVANMSIIVAGFTGADTYLNAGTLTNGKIVSGWTILSVSSTSIVFAISHANASVSTNGTVLQEGNGITSCAGLSQVFQDPALSIPNANPFVSDQLGNWNVFALSGFYDVQFYTPTTVPTLKIIGVPLVAIGGVPGLSGNNTFTGTNNFTNTATFTGTINCTIINAVRCISPTNPQGWAGAANCTTDLGVCINAAIAGMPVVGGYPTGELQIAQGNYTMATTVNTNSPSLWIHGEGAGATVVTCTMNADCFNTQLSVINISPGFKLGSLSILGTGSGNANAVGVHTGDMVGGSFYDLMIDNFLGANSSCLWMDNKTFWFERAYFFNMQLGVHGPTTAQLGCTKNLRQTVNGGDSSFESTTFTSLHMSILGGTTGISMESGSCSGCQFSGNANVIGNGATFFTASTTNGGNTTDMNFLVDTGSVTGAVLWNVPAGGTWDYQGRVNSTFSGPAPTIVRVGHLGYHGGGGDFANPISYGLSANDASIATGGVGTTYSTANSATPTAIGAYLQRDEGAADGFLLGLGNNLYFDPIAVRWTCPSDGANNSCSGILGSNSAVGLEFFNVPNSGTPAVPQQITNAAFSGFKQATLLPTGFSFATSTGGTLLPAPQVIANGTAAMTTALIAGGACGTTVTVVGAGILTTDTIDTAFNAVVTAANAGLLTLNKWVTAGNVNFNYCNPTAGNITPTAETVNWSVRRP